MCVNGEMICHAACILNNAIIRRGISVPVLHCYITLRGSPGSSRCPDGVTSVGRPGGFLPDTFPLFLPLLVLLPAWPCLPTFLREPLLRVLPRLHWRPPGAWSATSGDHHTCSLWLLLGCLSSAEYPTRSCSSHIRPAPPPRHRRRRRLFCPLSKLESLLPRYCLSQSRAPGAKRGQS